MTKVIKIGGNIIDDPKKLNSFLNSFKQIAGNKILVHGGGKLATELMEKMGLSPIMIDGKRVTDLETLKIVTMVYAGQINKNIVASLQSIGCNAIGLCGADANILQATKRIDPKTDWGFVGDVMPSGINVKTLSLFLDNGLVPVFSAITHDQKGSLLNTNADTIASVLASALAAIDNHVSLVYCFEKKGVLLNVEDENSVIKKITPAHYEQLKKNNVVNKGMLPKLDNAFLSLETGVSSVKICMAEDLDDFENAGTTITNF